MVLHLNYIGSKKTLFPLLDRVFRKYIKTTSVVADFFAGTGNVAMQIHKKYGCKVIANDVQYYAYVINRALLSKYSKTDVALISKTKQEYQSLRLVTGFFTRLYSPAGLRKRMYFTCSNAQSIDAMRMALEKDRNTLPENVYYYLLADIITSADKVANTSSVYASYLKAFKPTALKPLKLQGFDSSFQCTTKNIILNDDVMNIAERQAKKCDVVYLDPPYNTRQYSTYYHVLDTIAKYDSPKVHGLTGVRDDVFKSSFSSKNEVEDAFADLFRKLAGCKTVIMSYNDEGIVSLDRMKQLLKENHGGKIKVYKLPYKKFKAQQGVERNILYEFIFVSCKTDARRGKM